MRKFRVTVIITNGLLQLGNLEHIDKAIKCFDITLNDEQKANPDTFRAIILQKIPNILKYPTWKPGDKDLPESTMRVLSWSLIEG